MNKTDLIYNAFEYASAQHGDITDAACKDLFALYPQAAHCFLLRGEQFEQELKQQMVRDTIYAFFEYLDTPEEVEITFKYTIPQHQNLDIPLKYVVALMQSVANVACNSVPAPDYEATKACWDTVMQDFADMIYAYE